MTFSLVGGGLAGVPIREDREYRAILANGNTRRMLSSQNMHQFTHTGLFVQDPASCLRDQRRKSAGHPALGFRDPAAGNDEVGVKVTDRFDEKAGMAIGRDAAELAAGCNCCHFVGRDSALFGLARNHLR
jgi:hypothetical protein